MKVLVIDSLKDIGSALSFALRLKNRNNGTSQTHTPKKVAMSMNVRMRASPPGSGRQSALPNLRTFWRAFWVR